ncbi:sigma factor-like helix-turn-helix DNA-binding protein [Streptomyces sp. NPDC048045]|uniref:sigma factor-like helix-turn-helix DNA-binding protein n=1 Tax=Streptomyces sp. NPDC048045 TaxID=3154710 RepID=UPI00344493E2
MQPLLRLALGCGRRASRPDEQRDVVVLMHLRGYSVEDVAYHLGRGRGGVRHLDRLARRALRHHLGLIGEPTGRT